MSSLFSLIGRSVCVFGGGGYLSGPTCFQLAAHGAHVVVADVDIEAANQVVKCILDAGHNARAVELDVTDDNIIAYVLDQIATEHGSLDAVVNASFAYKNVPFDQMSLDDWRDGMRVNLDAAFLVSREAGRIMKAQGCGSIVQFSSMYGVVAPHPEIYEDMNVNPVHYGVAKAGVLQLVKYQAAIMGRDGVRVNAIVPGPFPFQSLQETDPGFVERLGGQTMLGRIGKNNEIAGAVVYLVSDASTYVTGTQITVDGGWTAW